MITIAILMTCLLGLLLALCLGTALLEAAWTGPDMNTLFLMLMAAAFAFCIVGTWLLYSRVTP